MSAANYPTQLEEADVEAAIAFLRREAHNCRRLAAKPDEWFTRRDLGVMVEERDSLTRRAAEYERAADVILAERRARLRAEGYG